jgi:transposase
MHTCAVQRSSFAGIAGGVEAAPQNSWAAKMKKLLLEINEKKRKYNGVLMKMQIEVYKTEYLAILKIGHKECPPPNQPDVTKKRGRIKKSKERNLLERLRNFQEETLRFMIQEDIPFTNNQGERDIRMIKVQQEISGCYKSIDSAKIVCRIRSYLLTCQKHSITPTDAMNTLFNGSLPEFCR